jgi:quercetin dioxygenase-like cupin family protein
MTFRSFARLVSASTLPGVLLASAAVGQTGGTCEPIADRAGRELGCFITAREELGALAAEPELFWHLDAYPTRAAAETARQARGTVVESFGRVWLFTIAPADWRPVGGTRVDRIGPLALVGADRYAAVYMEGIFEPGMASVVHRHDGVEAWHTLEGSMCLETPAGTMNQRAGDAGVMAPPHVPMVLIGTGTSVRRSLVLILQDSTRPRSTPAADWTPKGLCAG